MCMFTLFLWNRSRINNNVDCNRSFLIYRRNIRSIDCFRNEENNTCGQFIEALISLSNLWRKVWLDDPGFVKENFSNWFCFLLFVSRLKKDTIVVLVNWFKHYFTINPKFRWLINFETIPLNRTTCSTDWINWVCDDWASDGWISDDWLSG
jgi:hypothetical protein